METYTPQMRGENANKTLQGIKTPPLCSPWQGRNPGENANKTLQGIKTKPQTNIKESRYGENANKTLQGIKTAAYSSLWYRSAGVKTLIKPCKGLKRFESERALSTLFEVKTLIKPCKGLKLVDLVFQGDNFCQVKTLIKPCKGLKLVSGDGIEKGFMSENANKTLQGIKTAMKSQ